MPKSHVTLKSRDIRTSHYTVTSRGAMRAFDTVTSGNTVTSGDTRATKRNAFISLLNISKIQTLVSSSFAFCGENCVL